MAANIFKIPGTEVRTPQEFFDAESSDGWSNLLYMPAHLGPNSRTPKVIKEKTFHEISFKDTDIENIRFLDCSFKRCLFIGASFTNCEFNDCTFSETNTSKLRVSRCLLDPSQFSDNFDLVNDTNIAIGLFHALYKNATEEHQPGHAIESLYQMREAEFRHLFSQRKRKRIGFFEFLWSVLSKGVYRLVSGYGLRFRRVLIFALSILITFTFINYVFREHIFLNDVESIADAFYFTGVTITTLGYGDITPVTVLGKMLVVLQAISGFAVVSIVLAGVANKAISGR